MENRYFLLFFIATMTFFCNNSLQANTIIGNEFVCDMAPLPESIFFVKDNIDSIDWKITTTVNNSVINQQRADTLKYFFPQSGEYKIIATISSTESCELIVTVGMPDASFAVGIDNITQNPGESDFQICESSVLSFSPNSSGPYSWNINGVVTTSEDNPFFPVLPQGVNTISLAVGSDDCESTSSGIKITINSSPTASIQSSTTPDFTTCEGENLVLQGSGIGTYSWSASTGETSTGQDFTIASVTTGLNQVTLTVLNEGCSGTATQNIIVNPLPNPTLAVSSSSAPLCIGNEISFSLSESGSGTYSINNNGISIDFSNLNSLIVSAINTNDITVGLLEFTDSKGCTASFTDKTVTTSINPQPIVGFNEITTPCSEENSFSIQLNGNNLVDFDWYLNAINDSLTPTQFTSGLVFNFTQFREGTYGVIVGDNNLCKDTISTVLTTDEPPLLPIITPPSTLCRNQANTLFSVGPLSGTDSVIWNITSGNGTIRSVKGNEAFLDWGNVAGQAVVTAYVDGTPMTPSDGCESDTTTVSVNISNDSALPKAPLILVSQNGSDHFLLATLPNGAEPTSLCYQWGKGNEVISAETFQTYFLGDRPTNLTDYWVEIYDCNTSSCRSRSYYDGRNVDEERPISTKLTAKIFPNPVSGNYARVQVNGTDPGGQLTLAVYDLNGQLVRQWQERLDQRKRLDRSLHLGALYAGYHLLRVVEESSGNTLALPLLIHR